MMYGINFIKGMFIGIANIIPGVSGGTIAVILGIFDKLIDSINNFTKNVKGNLLFLTPILLGTGFSVIAFSSILEHCLNKYSLQTSLFFVGLVCGSIPLIYKKATSANYNWVSVLLALVAIIIVVVLSNFNDATNNSIDETLSAVFLLKIFGGGVLAAAAMIIPGISGSFVMMLLGIYPTVLHAIANVTRVLTNLGDYDLMIRTGATLFALGIGVVIGIVLISKLISFLMSKYYSTTYFTILGLMLGSIYGIFAEPMTYQSGTSFVSIAVSVLTLSAGYFIAIKLGDK